MLQRGFHNFSRQLARLPHAQAADGVPRKPNLNRPQGRFSAQLAIHPTLDNAKERLSAALIRRVSSFWFPVSVAHGTRNWKLETGNPRHLMLMLLKIFLTPRRPPRRQFHRSPHPRPIRRILRALIERHDDVRTQPDLRLHRALRTEEMRRPVQMRTKRHTLLRHLAQFVQAENLK